MLQYTGQGRLCLIMLLKSSPTTHSTQDPAVTGMSTHRNPSSRAPSSPRVPIKAVAAEGGWKHLGEIGEQRKIRHALRSMLARRSKKKAMQHSILCSRAPHRQSCIAAMALATESAHPIHCTLW